MFILPSSPECAFLAVEIALSEAAWPASLSPEAEFSSGHAYNSDIWYFGNFQSLDIEFSVF